MYTENKTKTKTLKEFVYLDTNFLHSFMAQTNSGLPTLTSSEYQESEQKTSTTGKTGESTHQIVGEVTLGEFDVVVFKSPTAKAQYTHVNRQGNNSSISLAQLEAGKEIISKQLHDNALGDFEVYLEENHKLKIAEPTSFLNPGEYFKVSGVFQIVDLSFYKRALSKKMIDRFVINAIAMERDSELEKVEKEGLNASQKSIKTKEIRNHYDRVIKQNNELFDMISDVLDYISTLLPTDSYIKIGRYVAPIKPEFLRESSNTLSFKYGSKSPMRITMIGKITRVYDNLISSGVGPGANIHETMQLFSASVEQFLMQTDLLRTGDLIVSPIAIFFEEDGN